MENWLRTDESQQAILALQIVGEHLPRVTEDPHHWCWVIVALHNCLQGFMVLALRGSNGLNVLTDKCAKEWMEAYERGDTAFPESRLASLLTLYKRIKSDRMRIYTHSRPFEPTGTQEQSVKTLNDRRNEVIHFAPKGWSLEVTGLPQIVEDCLGIVEFLAFHSANVIWQDELLEAKARVLIEKVRIDAGYIRRVYGG